MTEQKIQKDIVKYLESRGAYVVKVVKATKSGVPDVVACLNGLFIAIEVKKPGGKVSKLQEYNISKVRDSGGLAFVAYGVEDVKNYFEECS